MYAYNSRTGPQAARGVAWHEHLILRPPSAAPLATPTRLCAGRATRDLTSFGRNRLAACSNIRCVPSSPPTRPPSECSQSRQESSQNAAYGLRVEPWSTPLVAEDPPSLGSGSGRMRRGGRPRSVAGRNQRAIRLEALTGRMQMLGLPPNDLPPGCVSRLLLQCGVYLADDLLEAVERGAAEGRHCRRPVLQEPV